MKLKRVLALIIALVTVCSIAVVPAMAASGLNKNEQAIYNMLNDGIQIGKVKVYYFNGRLGEAYNFFNRDGVDMTDAQYEEVMSHLSIVYELAKDSRVIEWAEAGNTSLALLPRDVKEKLLAAGTNACAVMGLTFIYNSSNNTVTITDADGNVLVYSYAVVTGNEEIKQTGAIDNTGLILAIVAMGVVLAGAAVVTVQKRKVIAAAA